MDEHMLTTIDNPYDPFTQFDAWYQFDTAHHYYTVQFLARIVKTSENLSDANQSYAIEQAIDEIIKENVLGIYKRVARTKVSDSIE